MKNKLLIGFLIFTVISSLIVLFTVSNRKQGIKNKRIVVTAPINYNKRLCSVIEKNKGIAISMPTISIYIKNDNPKLDSLLYNLSNYKYIALPSRNAIKAFYTRAKELRIPDKILQKPIYSAIGKDTEYLKELNLLNILSIDEPSPKGIATALSKTKNIKGKMIAVLAPEVVGLTEPDVIPSFIELLNNIGLKVTRINAYTTQINNKNKFIDIISDIKKGNIDLIAFTSSAEIEALLLFINGKEHIGNAKISCFGPYTSANAKKAGLIPCFTSTNYRSFNDYVKSMNDFFLKE